MATTIPPVHNYESQIVFSNQSNNIKSTDVINWTIAPSGDDVYFNLYKSRMTFKLKITGLANNATGSPKVLYVPIKKTTRIMDKSLDLGGPVPKGTSVVMHVTRNKEGIVHVIGECNGVREEFSVETKGLLEQGEVDALRKFLSEKRV